MKAILLDADAFLCARRLRILDYLLRKQHEGIKLHMTQYVARHELASLTREVNELCAGGLLTIEAVPAKNVWNLLRAGRGKKDGIHKGEAEAIVWAKELPKNVRPLFISNDDGARKGARRHNVPAGDLMDFLVEAILAGVLSHDEARQLVAAWDDKVQEQCRPGDWNGFDNTFARRQAQRT